MTTIPLTAAAGGGIIRSLLETKKEKNRYIAYKTQKSFAKTYPH